MFVIDDYLYLRSFIIVVWRLNFVESSLISIDNNVDVFISSSYWIDRSSRVCRFMYNEADLNLSCLRRLVYGCDNDTTNTSSSTHFNLISQPEINRQEVNELEDLCRLLTDRYETFTKTSTNIPDDDSSMCIICCSHHIEGEFRPCKHQACL
jgi:hypothetical protein